MLIVFRPRESDTSLGGLYIGVLIDNGYTVRSSSFHSWSAVFGWLRAEANRRQDPAGRDLWNYTIKVQGV